MKTRQFNIDEVRAGAKVTTRDGQKVESITYFKNATKARQKLVAVVDGDILCYDDQGNFLHRWESQNDLVIVEEDEGRVDIGQVLTDMDNNLKELKRILNEIFS